MTTSTSLGTLSATSAFAVGELGDYELPCWSHDPELFFSESATDVQSAKRVCAGCPWRRKCLAGARERREPWGVWGGELFVRGVVVAHKRSRGRPRKTGVAV